jgi:hypothetical protein
MIRFAWIQFRMQTVIAAGALVIITIVLVATGPHLVNLYDTTVANCTAQHDCSAATTALTDTDGPLQISTDLLLLVVPVVIGVFWGAPLASREFEAGTFRLVWTQSVTRTRWLLGKLGLGLFVSMASAGLLTLMVTWWSSPIDRVQSNVYNALNFSARDIAPIGYAAFSFVLGVTAGVLLRRLLPAMFVALAGFVAVREIVARWVRPNLFTPLHKVLSIGAGSPIGFDLTPSAIRVVTTTRGLLSNGWVYSVQLVDKAGHGPSQAFLRQVCPFNRSTGIANIHACTVSVAAKFHEVVTYQPASRYWSFQWCEVAIFLGLAAVLAGVCVAWIRRPVA